MKPIERSPGCSLAANTPKHSPPNSESITYTYLLILCLPVAEPVKTALGWVK